MPCNNAARLLNPDKTALVIIDIQERLWPVISDKEFLLENAVRLAKFSKIIDLPVLVTEQQKMGATKSELAEALGEFTPVPKVDFDSFAEPDFRAALAGLDVDSLLLCGMEAHICVAQTCLTGLDGYNCHVLADVSSSRTEANRAVGMDRMARAGAVITTTEIAIYELLRRGGTPEFKQTLPLVK